jgi:hypothetical protein
MSEEIVRDHRTEQCRSPDIPLVTAMLAQSFGDLFQRWRKLRLSVLVAFLGRFRWRRNLFQRLSLFFGRWFVDLVCRSIRGARFTAAVLATPSRRPSLDYQSVIEM